MRSYIIVHTRFNTTYITKKVIFVTVGIRFMSAGNEVVLPHNEVHEIESITINTPDLNDREPKR